MVRPGAWHPRSRNGSQRGMQGKTTAYARKRTSGRDSCRCSSRDARVCGNVHHQSATSPPFPLLAGMRLWEAPAFLLSFWSSGRPNSPFSPSCSDEVVGSSGVPSPFWSSGRPNSPFSPSCSDEVVGSSGVPSPFWSSGCPNSPFSPCGRRGLGG